jgi:hypothetical protein
MLGHDAQAILHPVSIADLRPTQMSLGLREVDRKRHRWRGLETDARRTFLTHHMIPTVIGLKGRRYVVDHHHLCRALLDEGADGVFTVTVKDLSHVAKASFWTVMEHFGWAHAYDHAGRRTSYDAMPRRFADMKDDPFRSLAAELRMAGGFAKETTPYHEFLWADFLRGEIDAPNLRKDFDAALKQARKLARSPAARHLPGWCGAET